MWIQLVNNSWIYFAPQTDTVTIPCNKNEPVDAIIQGVSKLHIDAIIQGVSRLHIDAIIQGESKLHINPGCKGYSTSALLYTSSIVMSNSSLQGGDLLTQIPLQLVVVRN
jgi:hypothetical protein